MKQDIEILKEKALDNKYTKYYLGLVNSRLNRFTSKKEAKKVLGYVESHHILPSSLGGTESEENKLYLTAKEHFIAHRLLSKMFTGEEASKMSYAIFLMCISNSRHERIKTNSRTFTKIKSDMAENARIYGNFAKNPDIAGSETVRKKTVSRKASMKKTYGVEHNSQIKEVKERMDESLKITSMEKWGVEHPFLAKEVRDKAKNTILEKYGVDSVFKVPEIYAKAKENRDNTNIEKYGSIKGYQTTQEGRDRASKNFFDKDEQRKKTCMEKYGVDSIAKIPVTCPHCGHSGKAGGVKRFHFNQCKFKKVIDDDKS